MKNKEEAVDPKIEVATIGGRQFVLIGKKFLRGRMGQQVAEFVGVVEKKEILKTDKAIVKYRVRPWDGKNSKWQRPHPEGKKGKTTTVRGICGVPAIDDKRVAEVLAWYKADAEKYDAAEESK